MLQPGFEFLKGSISIYILFPPPWSGEMAEDGSRYPDIEVDLPRMEGGRPEDYPSFEVLYHDNVPRCTITLESSFSPEISFQETFFVSKVKDKKSRIERSDLSNLSIILDYGDYRRIFGASTELIDIRDASGKIIDIRRINHECYDWLLEHIKSRFWKFEKLENKRVDPLGQVIIGNSVLTDAFYTDYYTFSFTGDSNLVANRTDFSRWKWTGENQSDRHYYEMKLLSVVLAKKLIDPYFEMFLYYVGSSTVAGYAFVADSFPKSLSLFQEARGLNDIGIELLERMKSLWPEGNAIFNNFNQMFYWQDQWLEHLEKYKKSLSKNWFQPPNKSLRLLDFRKKQIQLEELRKQHMEMGDSEFIQSLPNEIAIDNLKDALDKRFEALMLKYQVPAEFYKKQI